LRKRKIRGGATIDEDVTSLTYNDMETLLYEKKILKIIIKFNDDDATEHIIEDGLIKYVTNRLWSLHADKNFIDFLKNVNDKDIIPAEKNNKISSIILTYEKEGEKDGTGNPTSVKSSFISMAKKCLNRINCTSIKKDDVHTPSL
jgi:hypothetical protein